MAQLLKFSSPVMRSRTGLNADDAPRRLAKEGQDLRPPQLPTDDHRAGCTNPVNLKNRLGDIQTNRCNLLHGWLLSIVIASTATTVWHLDAGGGAVHSIISGHRTQGEHVWPGTSARMMCIRAGPVVTALQHNNDHESNRLGGWRCGADRRRSVRTRRTASRQDDCSRGHC